MENLMFLDAIRELENAEENAVGGNNQNRIQNMIDPVVNMTNRQFISVFRLSKELFQYLENILQPHLRQGARRSDIDIRTKILTALRFFASGGYQMDIGSNWCLGLSQSSVSRCIKEVVTALNHPNIFNEFVKFPRNINELNDVRLRFYRKYRVPGIIGCIDCTHIAIFPPHIEDPVHPEHLYVNRKGYHSLNVQLICDSTLKIINVNALYPGSTNDAFIWSNSQVKAVLENMHVTGNIDYYLLGDSGYPLRSYLLTPVEGDPAPDTPESRYNNTHKRIRSIIERCNGILKMRFRCCLKHRVLHYSPEFASQIVNACVILHNLCIEHNVPEPEEHYDEIDLGLIPPANDLLNVGGRINPELVEGRRARQRIIQSVFVNN